MQCLIAVYSRVQLMAAVLDRFAIKARLGICHDIVQAWAALSVLRSVWSSLALRKKKRALNLNKLKVVAILYIFVFHVQNENMSLAPKAVWEAVRHQSFTRHFLRKGGGRC